MNKDQSIRLLNRGVADELEAVHQYMFFHFHLSDQGFQPLADLFKRIAIQEMGHLEQFAERVLFLKGEIKMEPAGPVAPITDPVAILDKAMAMEQEGVRTYNAAAFECSANADAASKHLFEQLVGEEENRFDQFEKQRHNIQRFGPNYLALQSFGSGRPAA